MGMLSLLHLEALTAAVKTHGCDYFDAKTQPM
jgi:hypothetical protein